MTIFLQVLGALCVFRMIVKWETRTRSKQRKAAAKRACENPPPTPFPFVHPKEWTRNGEQAQKEFLDKQNQKR